MKSLFAELRSRLGSNLKGVLPKWHGLFQARLTPSAIPSEVEESLILTITSSKRCLDCARHDKEPIWATRPKHSKFKRAQSRTRDPSGRCASQSPLGRTIVPLRRGPANVPPEIGTIRRPSQSASPCSSL